jgi:hypothetical protein
MQVKVSLHKEGVEIFSFQLNQPPITPLAITQLPGTGIQVICPPQGEWRLKICLCRSHQSCLHSAHTIGYEPNLEGSAFSGYMRNYATSFFLHFPIWVYAGRFSCTCQTQRFYQLRVSAGLALGEDFNSIIP